MLRKIINRLRRIKTFIINPRVRSEMLVRRFHSDEVQQTTQQTEEDRYPEEFEACVEYFGSEADINILSFGCCTGEEVVTLRRYFPNATIVGADINNYSLKKCRQRKLDSKIRFIKSSYENIMKYGPYDAVFCMAVLQRTPMRVINEGIIDISDMYPYDKYEKQIVELDKYVKPEGLLFIHFTQYDFLDTLTSKHYQSYGSCKYTEHVFDKHSMLKGNVEINTVYKKTEQ